MLNAEKKCRRIKSGRIPFLPQASIWIRRSQLYCSLLRFHLGKIRNRGNLKRAVRRCKIHSPFTLSLQEIDIRTPLDGGKYERNLIALLRVRSPQRGVSRSAPASRCLKGRTFRAYATGILFLLRTRHRTHL